MLLIIDVSHWQGQLTQADMDAFKAAGVVGIIAKAYEADAYPKEDADYQNTKTLVLANGFLFGSYVYDVAGSGVSQADVFIAVAGLDGKTMPCLDWENYGTSLAQTKAMLAEIGLQTGIQAATIYTRAGFVADMLATKDAIIAQSPLWQADPNSTGDNPIPCPPWTSWFLWQRGSSIINSKNVDHNYFNGTLEQLTAIWTAQSTVTPETTPRMVMPNDPPVLQIGPTANLRVNDCIVAVSQWMWYWIMNKGGISVAPETVDSWTRQTTLMQNDNGLTIGQGIALAASHGAYMIEQDGASVQNIVDQIMTYDYPVMCLGWSGAFPNTAPGNHCVAVIGASNRRIWVMDPDFSDPTKAIYPVTYAQMDAFLYTGGASGQIALVDPTQIGIPQSMGSTINILVTATNGLNERAQPSVQFGKWLRKLPKGFVVTVNATQTVPGWWDVYNRSSFIFASGEYSQVTTRPATEPQLPPTPLTGIPQVTLSTMNIRTSPSVTSTIIKTVPVGTVVIVNLNDKRVEPNTGNRFVIITEGAYANDWIALDNPTIGAIYLSNITAPPVVPPITPPTQTGKMWGINLNPKDPTGNPSPQTLAGVGWVRLVFNTVINNTTAGTIQQALDYYRPIIQGYNAAGIKVNLIMCQSLYWGNGPWDNGDWPTYITNFAAACTQVVTAYKDMIAAYEIWNEQDISGQPTSIYIAPVTYGMLLTASAKAIKASDPAALVISGGVAGPDPIGYMTQVQTSLGKLPVDGVSYHPYGQNAPGCNAFGWPQTMASNVLAFQSRFGLPCWITEVGVPRVNVNDTSLWPIIANYMQCIFNWTHANGVKVQWFAWSDNMDSAGIVNNAQQPKNPIKSTFDACVIADSGGSSPAPVTPPVIPPTPPSLPPSPTRGVNLTGLHIQASTLGNWGNITAMAQRLKDAGKPLASCVVIDKEQLANELAPLVNYVIFRKYAPGELFDVTQMITPALATAHADFMWNQLSGSLAVLDKRVYIQSRNEKGYQVNDYAYELQIMARASNSGFRAAIYGDSVGTPQISEWQTRIPALTAAMANGHVLVTHQYGAFSSQGTPTDIPVDDPRSIDWYSCRHRKFYSTLPANAQPTLIIGETGMSDTSNTPVANWKNFNELLLADSYVEGYCIWGCGATDKISDMNGQLSALEAMILAL